LSAITIDLKLNLIFIKFIKASYCIIKSFSLFLDFMLF